MSTFVAEAPIIRRAIAHAVQEAAAGLRSGARVLDAGAGSAPYRPFFAHCEFVTLDWPESVHAAGRGADIVADLHDLPIEDREYDFVLCTEVLEHVGDPAMVLSELGRVVVPGGKLLLTTPFVIELHEEPNDYYRYTPYALRRLVEGAGLNVESIRPLTGWWSMLAHTTRSCFLSTSPTERPAKPATWLLGALMVVVSVALARLAPLLDRFDERRALPLGFVCAAERPHATS